MNEADKILLDGLRLVADASDDVWALVEAEVAKAGSVRNVTGQARLEIERAGAKARTLVEKHGTHDQSAHSGKKGGGGASAPSDAPSGGGGNSQAVAYKTTHDAGVGASKKMAEHANTMTREIAGHGAKSGSRDSVELSSITDDLDAVMADVADLPAGKSRAIEAVRNHRTRLQQTALTAKGLDNPRSTDSAIKAIRQTATELKLLEATITEAWNGVPDLSQG